VTIQKKPFVFDGAFGTYYYQKRTKLSPEITACEFANLEDKEIVYKIHRDYIAAGVDAIKTNTYGVNSNLNVSEEKLESLLQEGFEIARLAAKGTDVQVFADIGYINSEREAPEDEYIKLAKTFIKLGAKNFLFETLAEFAPIIPALRFINSEIKNPCIIVAFAVSQDGYSNKGLYFKDLIQEAASAELVYAVGLNCTCGPSHMFQLLQGLDFSRLKNTKLCAMPNAGYPSNVNGRTFYRDNIEYFSDKLSKIFGLGVEIVGGCCGTTPTHIKAALESIQMLDGSRQVDDLPKVASRKVEKRINLFREKMFSGRKVIAVEIDPPIDTDVEYLVSAAYKARAAGADVITISDSPLARTRADCILMAAKIRREVGIDVLPHLSCRDRNHIGIKGALMGASIEDVSNVLVVTGDPIASADRSDYKGVFSMSSFNLISYIQAMNKEVFADAPFFVGAALNVNANQMDLEIARAVKKTESGAEFFLTQPVFSEQAISNVFAARKQISAKLLAGLLPIASHRNALFLNNEVSGINIPQAVIERFQGSTPEEAERISFNLSASLVKLLWDACDGFYLITPLKKIDLICKVVEFIRKDEKRRSK